MKNFFRRLLILVVALLCLFGPTFVNSSFLGYNRRAYTPPAIDAFTIAATPAPTATPVALDQTTGMATAPLRRGPIVVDLAHFNRVNPSSFQPLEAALAAQGVGLRLWLSNADISKMQSYLDFPDQSQALAEQLSDASGLIVISPFFLWSKLEIALVEKFVANGGRLLMISDPDVQGDFPTATNMLAAPFGIVFNDDYLYDTVANDENYTHFFQKSFADQASKLNGSQIVFYGGRSISGGVTAQVHSAPTTLSSLRTGQSEFTTVAIGGQQANQSTGRVLAMSDFDVLTEPYITRFDNRRILDFTATFLSASQRADTLANFPSYLGKDIALVVGGTDGINAALLQQGAQLQQRLETSGRNLTLAGTQLLTVTQFTATSSTTATPRSSGTVTTSVATTNALTSNAPNDLIYIAQYEAADKATTLLHDLGITLVKEVTLATSTPEPTATVTPEKTATATVTDQPQLAPTLTMTATVSAPELPTDTATPARPDITGTAVMTETPLSLHYFATAIPTSTIVIATPPPVTATSAPSTPTGTATPKPTPTPEINFFLETTDGLRLVAEQTLLIVQRQQPSGQRMVAVLGMNAASVEAGITRLLNNDLKDCMLRRDLAICPVTSTQSGATDKGRATEAATPAPSVEAGKTPEATKPSTTPSSAKAAILLVDDNAEAKSGETSEADFYLQVLTKGGNEVKLWTTAKDGAPQGTDLAQYTWVIWSDAAYASSGIGTDKLQAISDYLGKGGHILLSSRLPFFAVGNKPASALADVVVVKDIAIPNLVRNLPSDPIILPANLPPVVPLQVSDEVSAPVIALRRGPQSSDPDAPLLLVLTDAEATDSVGARLMIMGMSISWFPQAIGEQLVTNMAEYMLKAD
ncbi:MAG: hypothetical protein NT075_14420 [Chloroflexi bacterium]|nr:hypothetical protein [Chloroflexota bacterium]